MSIKSNIQKRTQQAQEVLNILYPWLKTNKNKTTPHVINSSLSTRYIRPIFTYGTPIWNIISKNNRKHIQRTENKILWYMLIYEMELGYTAQSLYITQPTYPHGNSKLKSREASLTNTKVTTSIQYTTLNEPQKSACGTRGNRYLIWYSWKQWCSGRNISGITTWRSYTRAHTL